MDEREISNITSESGLIATLIHNPSFVFYSENLLPNHFTDKQNACMYLAISNLAQQSVETIDAYNIISSLESSEATRKLVDELRILNCCLLKKEFGLGIIHNTMPSPFSERSVHVRKKKGR